MSEPASARLGLSRNPVLLGIIITAATAAIYPVSDAISKHLMPELSSIEVVWGRYIVHLVGIALWVVFRRSTAGPAAAPLRSGRWKLQIARGLLISVSSTLIVTSFLFIPLVDALSVTFLGPVLAVVLSGLVLRERIGRHRWIAAVVGFAAVLLILRPGLGVVHWASGFALLGACLSACHQLITRQLASTETAFVTFAWTTAVGTLVSSVAMPFVWVTPSLKQCLMLLGAGLLFGLAQYGAVQALRFAPVSAAAPYNYVVIPSALVVGYVVFGELPDGYSFAGAILLILAGLYAFRREARPGQTE